MHYQRCRIEEVTECLEKHEQVSYRISTNYCITNRLRIASSGGRPIVEGKRDKLEKGKTATNQATFLVAR